MKTYELMPIEKCLEAIKILNVIAYLTPQELEQKLPLIHDVAESLSVLHTIKHTVCYIQEEVDQFKRECIEAFSAIACKWLPLVDAELKRLINEKVK